MASNEIHQVLIQSWCQHQPSRSKGTNCVSLRHLHQILLLIIACFITFFISPSCLSSATASQITRNSRDLITRFRRQAEKEFEVPDEDTSNSNTTSHENEEHTDHDEYYKDQLNLMEWLKGPLIILGLIVVLSLCLFFLYIYKYRSEVGTRRQSMVSSQMHQIRRNTVEPSSPLASSSP